MPQERLTRIGRGRIDLDLILATFRLDGEDVVRISSEKVVKPPKARRCVVNCGRADGKQVNLYYHRIKFALAKGYLPEQVDHRDTDWHNSRLGNLRAATNLENNLNKGPRKRKSGLPRGVYPIKTGGRFFARIKWAGLTHYLGSYDTPDAASQIVEARLKVLHGEFYHAPV